MEAGRLGRRERLRRVVYDTSILLLAYEGVDVFGDTERVLETRPECIVTSKVVEELERLAARGQAKTRRAARLALTLLQARNCRVVDVEAETADDSILAYVLSDPEAIVATADGELRRRLREKGLPHIFYWKGKGGLQLEG